MTINELNKLKQKYKIIEMTADFINPSYNISRAKHLDTARYIVCTLTENGIPRNVKENETARIRLQKPDRTYVYNDCDILEDGRIFITLTEQILSVEGNAVCDIQITDEETEIIYSTKNFIINIDGTAVNNSIIESSDEFGALNSLISTNKKLNTELQADENIRIENENTRVSSENIRKTNENARKNAESQRISAENTRVSNENTRIADENTRKANETSRQTDTALAISNAEQAAQKANNAADDLQNKLDSNHFVLTEDKGVAGGVPELASDGKIPLNQLHDATLNSKGITKLTDSVTSTSTTTAATAKSVKTAYDKAASAVNDLQTHNSSSAAHDDIRTLISGLTSRLNALADSDDTTLDQLSEIVAYIKNNKSLIDNITTSKVSVSDITDSLISASADKPLSAKQGKVLNDLISALTDSLDNKVDKVSGKVLSSNDYTDEEKAKLQSIYDNTDNKYLQLTGGTVDGDMTIKNNKIDILTLTRKDTSNGAAIKYQNNANVLGYLGFDGSGNPAIWEGNSPTVSGMRTILLANKQNTGTLSMTTTVTGGTALVLDNSNSADDRTYMAFKNKGQNAGYLSMSGNDLYTYKNSSNCKVLDSKNYTSVITDYMRMFEVKNSIKLKVPVTKTADTDSYYAAALNHTIKAETVNAVAFLNKQISTSASNISYRNGSVSNISAVISNIYGENYVYITLTNKDTTCNMLVEFSNNSGISVESAT